MDNSALGRLFEQAQSALRAGDYGGAVALAQRLQGRIGDHPNLLHLLGMAELKRGNFAAAVSALSKAAKLGPGNPLVFRDLALALRSAGDAGSAADMLRKGLQRHPAERELVLALAEAERASDRRDSAAATLDKLLAREPEDHQALYARAMIELERGKDARPYFAPVLAANPGNRQLIIGAASAMQQAGDMDSAISLLQRALAQSPDWGDGHRALARLRFERGDGDRFTDGFETALQARRQDVGLWASFLGVLSSALQFDRVLHHLAEARQAAGEQRIFDMFEAQALSETGRLDEAEAAFDGLGRIEDSSFLPMQMRFLLRAGRHDAAARLGEHAVRTPSAPMAWPLLALAWRKLGDRRWQWLERYDDTVATFELPLGASELAELADALRRLHRDSAYPYDQSARGGTQTIGHLLYRSDPPLRRLGAHLRDAVAAYIQQLPPLDPDHPFLGRRREGFDFAGSWSIRLEREGYHVSHVHPQGWISSACYIALPRILEDDPNREGWLKLGESPPELGLELAPVRTIAPKPGRLVLFPSIMWHGTVPFGAGERLSVAFDVVPRESMGKAAP